MTLAHVPSATSASEPDVLLRLSQTGINTAALQCDSGVTLQAEMANGCATPYALNPTTDCSSYGPNSLPPLDLNPDPAPNCVALKTGTIAALSAGLKARFENPCSPNNWSSFPNLAADDPRIVYLFVTSSSAIGSGSLNQPVVAVARFYATGWDISTGASAAHGCPGNDPHPVAGSDDGDIWGHFIP